MQTEKESGQSKDSAQAKTQTTKDKEENVSSNREQRAIDAIKYCLRMYKSELKYDKITSVPKSDGTVDVIIDYKFLGDIQHTYYNVSVYSNGECRVNSISGFYEACFPYGDKFTAR